MIKVNLSRGFLLSKAEKSEVSNKTHIWLQNPVCLLHAAAIILKRSVCLESRQNEKPASFAQYIIPQECVADSQG